MFVSLHNHSSYSLLDALSTPKQLLQRAKELNQPAIAITDHGTLACAWDAYKTAKELDVKLIIGIEAYFASDDEKFKHIILIAKNAIGYRNLLTLNKNGFDNLKLVGKKVYSVINWELLEKYSEGLICLTACGNGIVAQHLMEKNFIEAETVALRLKNIFKDDLALEVQTHNLKAHGNFYTKEIEQSFINRQIINLGKKLNIKVVPTTNSHYIYKEQANVQDGLLAIGSHQTVYSNYRLKYNVPDLYVKSYEEVKSFFSRTYGEEYAEELCKNSIEFAEKCEVPDWINPQYSNPSGKELPEFPVQDESDYNEFLSWKKDDQLDEDKQYLRFVCEKNFHKVPNTQEYKDRLEEEFEVIEFHGFSSYMLIVADYVNWARRNGIGVGSGRGSVGSSLIAYLIGVHCADPIKYKLIFARFHNKEKQSFPDIDLDFAPSGRDKVLTYLKNKYGEDRVAHVSNVNTITPKVYARDISRIFELGGDKDEAVVIGNTIADIIPSEIHSIDAAIKEVALFSEYGKKYPQLIDMKEINGKYRAWSTHAGGVIISKRSLVGLVPLRRDKDGVLCLEYDKVAAEDNGLVKMDILGLSTLDTIQLTYDLLKASGKEIPNDSNFDVYDEKTYNLLSSGDTFCVFQLGTSGGTMELCRGIKPKCIEDISHINALARPSSKEIRVPFIKAREKNEVKLLHPSLDRALSGTFGFGLYEECLMYLAADVAGWSLHKADGLRKLTKEKGKNPKKAKALLEGFMNDAIANNIEPNIAKEITYGIVSTFSGYGFNLSHSILYSMLSYQTAYLKAHYPTEFLLANLMQEVTSNSLNSEDNIKKIKEELRKHNISILPPNINESELHYTISDEKLLTGLNGLKFVGEDAIRDIIEKRPFKSFFDFMVRADTRKVRANTIQALAASGALDTFGLKRKDMYLYCQDYRKKLGVWLKKHNPLTEEFKYPWDDNKEWSKQELFALETKFIGESFICSLKEAYPKLFKEDYVKFKDIKSLENRSQIRLTKGIIKSLFEITIKKEGSKFYGKKMAKILLEDGESNFINLTIFPDRLEKINARMNEIHKGLCLVENIGLSFSASVNIYEDEPSLILNDLFMAYDTPALPKDLTAKKVTIKKEKSEQISIDDIESDLINEGLLSLDDD